MSTNKKVLLGVFSQLASRRNVNPLTLRIVFVIVGIVIPFVIPVYFIMAAINTDVTKKVIYAIYGAILGIPLSYYFQPEIVRAKVGGIGGYLQNFDKIFQNGDLIVNVFISVVVFAIVGGFIGYSIEKNEAKKAS
ncbi:MULTISPECIES: PspC domain-containing protein [unclassified Carboxylicivirga]|uniref:PspC domain-containing protein n=1 Tax=Carboxylicivirga TaxID=1628153 RepID=UPI003D3350D9